MRGSSRPLTRQKTAIEAASAPSEKESLDTTYPEQPGNIEEILRIPDVDGRVDIIDEARKVGRHRGEESDSCSPILTEAR